MKDLSQAVHLHCIVSHMFQPCWLYQRILFSRILLWHFHWNQRSRCGLPNSLYSCSVKRSSRSCIVIWLEEIFLIKTYKHSLLSYVGRRQGQSRCTWCWLYWRFVRQDPYSIFSLNQTCTQKILGDHLMVVFTSLGHCGLRYAKQIPLVRVKTFFRGEFKIEKRSVVLIKSNRWDDQDFHTQGKRNQIKAASKSFRVLQ